MGNWDHVRPYDAEAAASLAKAGLPRPAVELGNRSPTIREITGLDRSGLTIDAGGAQGDDAVVAMLRVRAESYEAELRFVFALAQRCGQQWIYPDSGLPSIVVGADLELAKALPIWREAHVRDDGWEWLYRKLYG